jgi:ribosome-associated toxin RatA of RatAB toxin-antitoxin module
VNNGLTIAIALTLCLPVLGNTPTKARLEKGDVIITTKKIAGSPIPEARVRALIDATPEKIWPLVEDCNNYKANMVRVKDAHEISRKGETVVCETTIDMPFPISDLTASTRARHTIKDGTYRRAWKLLKGDYEVNTGSWTLKAYDDGRTLVEYRIHAVPKIPVPGFLQQAAQSTSLPKLINHLRKRVASAS